MKIKSLFLSSICMLVLIAVGGCYHEGVERQPGEIEMQSEATTTVSGGELEAGQEVEVTEEVEETATPDYLSLFNAFQTDVGAVGIFGTAHKSLIKSTLKDNLPSAKWSDIKPIFEQYDIIELAIAEKGLIKDLKFIRFAEALDAATETAFANYADSTLGSKVVRVDLDGDGVGDGNVFAAYDKSIAPAPTTTEIEDFIVKKTENDDRILCLKDVDPAKIIGCAYIQARPLKKMIEDLKLGAAYTTKSLLKGYLLKDDTLKLELKFTDDDDKIAELEFSLDEDSDYGKEFFKQLLNPAP